MSTKLKLLCTFLMIAVGQMFYAQVTGTVVDEDNFGISDVLVSVQGSDATALTDLDGKFEIDAKVGDVLTLDNGGQIKSINVTSNSLGKVSMNVELEELVVTGYQTVSEPRSVIAQTTITAEDIENKPNSSVIQTLQGQVPGLNIMTSSGQPGSSSDVLIRGIGSVSGKTSPLYVVDGVQLGADEFAKFYNQNDIASATVLKDAAGTAQYGNKGSNGVIVITTKRGKFNAPLATSVTSTYGVSYIQENKYNLMHSQDLLNFQKAYGSGLGATLTDSEIAAYNIDTDWEKYFLKPDVTTNYDISFSNGGEKTKSFTSVGYLNQNGIVRKGSDLKRFTFRNNLDGKSTNDRFVYNTTLSLGYSKRNITGSVGTGGVNQNALLASQQGSPLVDPNLYEGSQQLLDLYLDNGTLLYTPLFIIDKLNTYKNIRHELKTNAVAEGKYKLLEGLFAGVRLTADYTNLEGISATNPVSFNSLLFAATPDDVGLQSESYLRDFILNNNMSLTYNKVLNSLHTFDAGAYLEYAYYDRKTFGYSQSGISPYFFDFGSDSGFIPDNSSNDLFVPTVNSNYAKVKMFSYFFLGGYDYDNRYGLNVSVRRDASSRFSSENRWGTFWSIGGRWNINKESFMANSKFDLLKLRASYGSTGNQFIAGASDFGSLGLYQTSVLLSDGYGGNTSNDYFVADKNVQWEVTKTFNIGLDLDYGKRFRSTLDYYTKKTEDLFRPVPVPTYVSPTGQIYSNFGSMKNSGFELLVEYDVLKKSNGLTLTLRGNGSYNKNEILDLPNGEEYQINGNTYYGVGDIVNSYYLIPYAGVNPANGELLFVDNEGNYTEELNVDRDAVHTNKSRIPVYQGSFGADFSYKGFYANVQFNYGAKLYRIDYDYSGYLDPAQSGSFNISTDILNYWTEDNRETNIPALRASQLGTATDLSDRFLIDASYVRLRNIRIGYNLIGSDWFLDGFLKSMNIFIQAENLKTWSKWKGWEPESNRASEQWEYPAPRSVQMGLQLNF